MSAHRNVFLKTRLHKAMTTALACSGLILASSISSLTLAQEISSQDTRQQFQIEAGDLGSTLTTFAARHNIALSFSPELTKDLTNTAISANSTPTELIDQLLSNTNLMMIANKDGTYSLIDRSHYIPEKESVLLDPLIIQTTRSNTKQEDSPQVITVITQQQIEEQLSISTDSSQALSSLLPAYSPNTQKLNNSSQTFRGRSVLYMIDGVPQSNPIREGSRSAHTIDLSMVERIEVIHGATAIHGLGATGGIINFITKSTRSNEIKQHVNVQMTTPTEELSSDTLSYKLGYQVEGSKGDFDYFVGLTHELKGMYLDADGEYVGAATVRGDIMDSESDDIFTKFGYWINDEKRLEFEFNQYQLTGQMNFVGVDGDRDNGIATSSVEGTPEGLAPYNEVQTTSLIYTDSDLNEMDFKAQLFHQDFAGRYGASTSNSFQDASIATDGTLYDQTENQSEKIGVKLSLTKDDLLDDTLSITTGFDVIQDTTSQLLILTDRVYVPETEYTNYAPFIQFEYNPIDRLVLQAGARYETAELNVDTYQTVAAYNSVTVDGGTPSFDETVVNAGAVFKLTPSVNVFANYSQGFGMPDVGRVLRSVSTTGQDVDDLIDLSPILTDSYEVGIRINRYPYDVEINYYESYSDLGSRIVLNDDGAYEVSREKQEIKGAEASLGYQFNKNHRLQASYSYVEGMYDDDEDGVVDTKLTGASIAPNRLVVSWNAHWNEKLSSMLQVNRAFSRSFDDDDLDFTGYTLVDTSLGYKLPIGNLTFSIANLLNEDYFTYYSQAAYANDSFYFKGQGRSMTLAYDVDF